MDMPKYSTHLLLKALQEQSENNLNLAISQWQMIPNAQFSQRPAPGSWSANECLQHLNSYGLYYLPAIENAIKHSGIHEKGIPVFYSGWLGNYFTRIMIPGTNEKRAKKMKSPKAHQPSSMIIESHAVISTFIEQQEKLLQLLEAAKQVDLNKTRVPISISKFIRLKLGDTFNFFVMHICRHVLQAQNALGSHASCNFYDDILVKNVLPNG